MRKYRRRLFVFKYEFNGEKCYHDVKMLPKYTREEALHRFKKANPNATNVEIVSTSIVYEEL